MNEVITVNKPRGLTPLQTIQLFKQKFPNYQNEKMSYAGRLDPMASGLLILLVGDQNKKRNEFESLQKTYEFELLLGITTDTYDALGLITAVSPPQPNTLKQCAQLLPLFIGSYEQAYPPFSSMHVLGKPLYYWAREGKLHDIKIPTKTVTIKSLEIISMSLIKSPDLVTNEVNAIKQVSGDFRQAEIIKMWRTLVKKNQSFPLTTCRTTVSSGTYIRSIAHEISKRLGIGGIAYSINRTQVGKYLLEDALEL
jgi:tRNA pseudouridine55 synthase